jgi:hypothetical protein
MNPTHDERALIDRLFRSGKTEPQEWDRLFAHLRSGCQSCAAYYAARRADASGGLPDEAPLTTAETRAITHVLLQRAQAEAPRPWISWSWQSALATATVAAAALLMVRPWNAEQVEPDAAGTSTEVSPPPAAPASKGSSERGGVTDVTGMTLSCLSAGPAQGLAPVGASGCPATGPLLLEGLTRAPSTAKALAMAVVSDDLVLLDFQAKAAELDASTVIPSVVERRGARIHVFALWSAAPIGRDAVEQALAAERAAHAPSPPGQLRIAGVLEQHSQSVAIGR